VHRGYFLSLGVHGWRRFTDAVRLLIDDPKLIEEWMVNYGEFSAQLAARILGEVEVDAAIFSEPIGGNHGPLISPKMYSTFVLKSYQPVLDVLKLFGVKTIILRTYANTRVLLPSAVHSGFNCLWACECNTQAMDYKQIRQEFGKGLRLIGGIDSDTLRQNRQDIYREVMDIVPPLLEDGGFIPLADGRVREDVTFDNYTYYRKLLESVTNKSKI
jgi:uroporphyrinogen decarboxylase